MKLEAAKGFIPVLIVAPFHALVQPLPLSFVTLLLGGAMAWAAFVLVHATVAALGLNRRHDAYMKAVGVDTSLLSILGDKNLWRKHSAGMTMREFIAERRTVPVRD